MPRKGRRRRIAPGIYADGSGLSAIVVVGSGERRQQREERFPIGTDLVELERWQLRTRATLLGEQPKIAARHTLAADVPRYLATLTGRRREDDRALLQHWIDVFGERPRHLITRQEIKAQLATWEEAGVAASSINHRLRALRSLYRELDGDEAPNPTDKIRKRREPEPEPRGVPYDLIEAIIAYMPDQGRPRHGARPGVSLSKARARVMAYTGLPPAQVMKILPTHVNWQHATLDVTPRRKGKGTKARTIPIVPQAIDALRYFFAVGATGSFSTSAFYKTWMVAQARLVRALEHIARQHDPHARITLARIRPYDLRHSFGSEAMRRSRNLLGVQRLLLHARLATTERYLLGAAEPAAQQVIEAWSVPTGANLPPSAVANSSRILPPVSKAAKRSGRVK